MSCDRSQCSRIAESCAVFNLRRAARAVTNCYEAELRDVGLKATQFSLLVAAFLNGPVAISKLAERMLMDRTTLTRNLKPLQKRGLLAVVQGSDRRTREVVLTAEGSVLLDRALPLWQRSQSRLVGALGEQRFESLLGELAATVKVAQSLG